MTDFNDELADRREQYFNLTLDPRECAYLHTLLGQTSVSDEECYAVYRQLDRWLDQHHPDELLRFEVEVEEPDLIRITEKAK
jgi:hypothetical protein